MTEPDITTEQLRSIGLFGALSDSALQHLLQTVQLVRPDVGAVLFREGDPADAMYVVLEGEIEVLKRSRQGTDSRVALLGPHDWFGEMSLVDIQPRSATVRAVASARLLKITSQDLDSLYRHDLKAYSLIVLNVARELSRRLRVADGILADLIANVVEHYLGKSSQGPRGAS